MKSPGISKERELEKNKIPIRGPLMAVEEKGDTARWKIIYGTN